MFNLFRRKAAPPIVTVAFDGSEVAALIEKIVAKILAETPAVNTTTPSLETIARWATEADTMDPVERVRLAAAARRALDSVKELPR